VLVVAAALLGTGCTTFDLDTYFLKSGGTVAQTSRDEWECRREVVDQPHTVDVWIGGVADAARIVHEAHQRERLMARCMRARGYEPSQPEGWWKSVNLGTLGWN
jgi:hypothetical protein